LLWGWVTEGQLLCVPMIVKGRVIGAIELLNKLNGQFVEDEAERLMRMAAFIGVAIQNAHLFQQVADGRDRLEAILNSTTDGILMADMHDVVLTANPTAASLFESNEQDLVGQTLDDLLRGLHARAHEVTAARAAAKASAKPPRRRCRVSEDRAARPAAPLYSSARHAGARRRRRCLWPARGVS
jgi:GAF domain-containing protein